MTVSSTPHWIMQGLIAAGLSTGAYAAHAQVASISSATTANINTTDTARARKDAATTKDSEALPGVSVKASTLGNGANYAGKIVQTGQYRGLDALDVPATVSTVTRDLLEAQAATGLYDALRNVAGVARQQSSGIAYDQLTVRGITLDNRGSYFLNGVLPIDNNIWMPMEDKERVEVLKGASALYYGFTVPAGIVNMVMKRAGETPVTSVGTVLDSHGSAGVKADVSRRFGRDNQFGLRVNAMDEHVESSIEGDRGYRRFASVAADWRVNSRLTLKYDLEHIDQRIAEQAGITPQAAVNGVITLPRLPSATTLLVPNDKKTNATSTAQLLRADYNLTDNWSANFTIGQSITQRDRWLWIMQKYNVNTGAGTLQGSKQNGQFYENKDVRAEVNGLFNTGPVAHDVTLGVQENWLFQPDFTTYYYTATQNLYTPRSITALTAAGSKAFYAQHVRTRGVYLFDRIALTPKWDFTLGARYSDYHQTQAGTVTQDVHRTSPSASLVFKVTPSTSIYGSYVEGLESPGSAPATASNAYQVLPAAVSRQEELGVRHRLSTQAMVSLAVFNLRQPTASTDATGYYGLSGMGRYRGVEFAFQGDATQRLSIVLSGMYLNSRLMNNSDPTTDGKRPENTPRYTASAFLNYKVPHLPGLSLNGGAYYISSRPINDANQAFIGGYTLFSAGARYETTLFRKHASFQLNVDNASNKHYWASAGSSQLGIGLERTITLTSTIDF
ncbi:TonB-dependent siderophore receptor [Robbsia andropogonis]|uniref:TonB-dependent siderophore receptor n=1 Tax=Robbsia andropogonis TaxID=28092 RepID=UPI002A6A2BF2|nr:TonB-dependent receptor [Robbsia andropogonis]